MKLIRYNTPTLGNWSPFQRLSPFQDLLESAIELAGADPTPWSPPLDVFENDDAITVRFELGGMKKEDFDISLEDDTLTLSGRREWKTEDRRGESFRSELFRGSFRRAITLPCPVKTDQVKASYTDGVLEVELPKAEEAKPRKIEVKLN
jgi:HSP20 family protein